MAMASWAVRPGIPTSAKPTELRDPTGRPDLSTWLASTVMRRVVKVRAGKAICCPAGEREAGPGRR